MEFLSLAEAWRWIQIGFCMAVGGGVIILGVLGAMMGSSSGADHEPETPHCSRCCPRPDADPDEP